MAMEVSRRFLAPTILSHTRKAERLAVLEGFSAGRLPVLIANRVLDEGVDVPEAKVAVVIGGQASSRQAKQRLGRILRRPGPERVEGEERVEGRGKEKAKGQGPKAEGTASQKPTPPLPLALRPSTLDPRPSTLDLRSSALPPRAVLYEVVCQSTGEVERSRARRRSDAFEGPTRRRA